MVGLFGASYDILLYDPTSTYFGVDANGPVTEASKLKAFGYSRDKRPDCVQIVIALIITPEGLPVGYEVLRGNTSDKTTLGDMLGKITKRYGKERRIRIMDRGIPTEETLGEMRGANPSVRYLVGTPKGRLTQLEKDLAAKEWHEVKDDVQIKLLPRQGELYVLARSMPRRSKESAMRRKKLKAYWARLKELQKRGKLTRDELLPAIGAAKQKAGCNAHRLVILKLPAGPGCGAPSERIPSRFTPPAFHAGLVCDAPSGRPDPIPLRYRYAMPLRGVRIPAEDRRIPQPQRGGRIPARGNAPGLGSAPSPRSE